MNRDPDVPNVPDNTGGARGARGTKAFASRGGEQRVRTAVGFVRRLADIGLRYRFRELQLLLVPCAVTFLPVVFPPALPVPLAVAPMSPLVVALGLSLIWLAANAALTVALPWVDQHVLPVAAMLVSTHYALARLPAVQIEWFPMTAGLIALYAALGVRVTRLAFSPRRRGRRRTSRSAGRAPLRLGAAILLFATVLLTLTAARNLLG